MPKYKDGTPAKAGDKVRGRAYGYRGPRGKPGDPPVEFTGTVVLVTPAETANVCVVPDGHYDPPLGEPGEDGKRHPNPGEFGQADHFVKVS